VPPLRIYIQLSQVYKNFECHKKEGPMYTTAVSYLLSFFTWILALITCGTLCRAWTAKSNLEYGECSELTMQSERYFMIFFILVVLLMVKCVRDYSKK
jgi:hypothetical protein